MAHYRGDGERFLEEAIREKEPGRKLDLIINALLLHFRELEHVLRSLGTENFSELGLREIRGDE